MDSIAGWFGTAKPEIWITKSPPSSRSNEVPQKELSETGSPVLSSPIGISDAVASSCKAHDSPCPTLRKVLAIEFLGAATVQFTLRVPADPAVAHHRSIPCRGRKRNIRVSLLMPCFFLPSARISPELLILSACVKVTSWGFLKINSLRSTSPYCLVQMYGIVFFTSPLPSSL